MSTREPYWSELSAGPDELCMYDDECCMMQDDAWMRDGADPWDYEWCNWALNCIGGHI